jgi:hypothetical protein
LTQGEIATQDALFTVAIGMSAIESWSLMAMSPGTACVEPKTEPAGDELQPWKSGRIPSIVGLLWEFLGKTPRISTRASGVQCTRREVLPGPGPKG